MNNNSATENFILPLLVSNSFDISLFEIFLPLLSGGTAIMTGEEHMKDVFYLAELLKKVNAFHAVPALMGQIIQHINATNTREEYTGIRDLFIGGDSVPNAILKEMRKVFPDARIHVLYGPTEATIFTTSNHYLNEGKELFRGALIGRPNQNRKIYILDQQEQLCPVGINGEICIGESGLARGYLNQPELTALKFVPNPFVPGERIYKTGDQGRWLPDGNIEFAGRIDSQVKIRGYRIELGEIESTLEGYKNITSAVVIARTSAAGDKELVACIVSDNKLDRLQIRSHLGKTLPAHMIPNYFVQLKDMPLTSNGKVDRKRLENSIDAAVSTGATYVAPQTETERKLILIWQKVLGQKKIGIKDSFFDLGGQSLKAIHLTSQIYKEFEVKLSLKEIFSCNVLTDQAEKIEQTAKTQYLQIMPATERPYYPLSSAQQRLWILSQFEGGNAAYNMPAVFTFEGKLDHAALNHSFNTLIERHESFRTIFKEDEYGETRQFIQPVEKSDFTINYYDVREKDEQQTDQLLNQEFLLPFDLTTGPLIRASLFRIREDKWIFTYVMHHIISDGWSMGILIRELLLFYNAFEKNETHSLVPLRIQYKDYSAWEKEQLTGEKSETDRKYWLKQMEGELPVLDLPGDTLRPAIKTYNGGVVSKEINPETTRKIKKILEEQEATLFMGLLAVVNVLLYRYTGQEDIITGSPVAGRAHADLEDQIGFYINTLALRVRFKGSDSYAELLSNIKQLTLNAYEHQMYPFNTLIDQLNLQRDMSRNPLFDVVVVLQEENTERGLQQPDHLKVGAYEGRESKISKFDLSFSFTEDNGGIQLKIEYNSDIYREHSVSRMASHLVQLLDSVIASPAISIARLDYLVPEEKQQLLLDFNDTQVAFPKDKTVIDLFREQVLKTPDHIAVNTGSHKLSYKELDIQSDQLAGYLLDHYHVKEGDLIGIMLDKSHWLTVAILGILKSGAAYVPVDPEYPEERKKFILEDTAVKVLVTQSDFAWAGYLSGIAVLELPELDMNGYGGFTPSVGNTALAYVIYTSGSTGNPKGVMIEHGSLTNLCYWHNEQFLVTDKDRATLYAGVAFDASVWEFFPYIITGASIYIVPAEIRLEVELLSVFYESNEITVSFLPTQIGERFMELDSHSLRYLLIGGDKLNIFVKKGYKVVNNYGPTEATVVASSFQVTDLLTNIPIGKPVSNTHIYILDEYQGLCPPGVSGEICIGGDSLARGYLNQDALTAEKFVADPFKAGGRIYKTGDLGRWLSDGNIEFTGRKDDQVKIRGYRIELGEIESVLQRYNGIDQAVVLLKKEEDGDKILVAYIVSDQEPDLADVRIHLSKSLPVNMLPHRYVRLDALPLTASGKVDKKKLPGPEEQDFSLGAQYIMPQNEKQEHLVAVYEEVLKRQPIGIKDDFFILGGDSIKAMQVVSRLKQRGYSLRMQDILLQPVAENLVKFIHVINVAVDQHLVEGQISLSPVQSFFLNNDLPGKHHFNQSVLLTAKEPVSETGIKRVIEKIIIHHDVLRMVYRKMPEGWIQENKGQDTGYSFEKIEVSGEAQFIQQCERIQSLADLENGPLFRVCLFKTPEGDKLLMVAHHLIIDGVSWRILLEDLSDLYLQYLSGTALTLPLKTHSFKNWQDQQLKYAKSKALQQEDTYWSVVEALYFTPLRLDDAGGSNLIDDTSVKSFLLDEEKTSRLLTKCYKAYHTEVPVILLTAIGLAIEELFGIKKMAVKLEGHGREDIGGDMDVTRTIGWFTAMYPVVFDLDYKQDTIRQLVEMKETLLRVPKKGIGYGILRYLGGKDYKLEPEITFNYLGDFGSGAETAEGDRQFEFSGEYHGKEIDGNRQRDSILDFSGIVTGGRISLSLSYSNRQFKSETMERLLAVYHERLTDIIDRLSGEEKVHLTPVDLTYKGLSMEQLQALTKKLM